MKGIVFTGNETTELMTFPDPVPGPDEVVLEIKASGMCGSDLNLYRGPEGLRMKIAAEIGSSYQGGPVIAGHEPCGVVVATGAGVDTRKIPVGLRAMQHHYDACGHCEHCNGGWTQLCREPGVMENYGATRHGGHAQYMKVPAHTIVPLPEELSFKAGATISCGTGTAWGALQRLEVKPGQSIAIFGQGPVGLSATLLAAQMGARVIALDTNAGRLKAAEGFGAAELLNPAELEDTVQAIRDLTGGLGTDLALDASASPVARRDAARCVRTWGKVAYVGMGRDVTFDVTNDLIRRQVTVMGSWTMSKAGQADCAAFIAERGLDIDSVFTHEWQLEEAATAYSLFSQQKTGKAVFLL
ncbi:zinc-binding dehydrogenase [Poseidonocella sp. HB161398]|uniref:zinc-dependent alcohol dehydrogenase family protein n=1 Tax=Poseidonocella sp. HB161398 TaxID=2320855 RepID=UPI0011091324|nr:zinc-binding dehydrogenase [Poseidonocella sp. HB161398]